MKKFTAFETQLGESVALTDKAKLSLYKKSQNSGYSIDILEEVYRRGHSIWNESFGGSPDSFAFDRVNSFISGGFAYQLDEDLRQWFDPKHPKGGWKRINSKGEVIGPCAREPGEPKPKCMSNEKRAQLSKKERAVAVAAKRRHDPVADRSGKGGKPVNVSNFGKGKISEEYLEEKNTPTNPSLWSKAKSLARSKFDVYPSAYANGWAAKWYKSKGGGWKSVSEESELEEKCWTGYKQVGMKKKGERMVPNCVPTSEDAEAHSKDFKKPSSRFIGSNELVDIYKSQTPGQIIKKVIREHLQEAAMYMPPQIEQPRIERPAPQRQFSRSVTTSGRMGSGAGAQTARVQVQRAAPMRAISSRFGGQGGSMTAQVQTQRAAPMRSTTSSMPAGQSGAMTAKPTVTKGVEATKYTVQKGMSAAGREAATKAAEKVIPAAAGRAAGALGGVAGAAITTAAPELGKAMAASHKAGHQSFKPHSDTGEKASDVFARMKQPSQGRSISQYEKDVFTPKKTETPDAPKPKVTADVPTPPSRPEYFSRGQAFSAAREKAGGGTGQFTYDSKPYQTNIKSEPYIPSTKQKSTGIDAESGGKKKIKENLEEASIYDNDEHMIGDRKPIDLPASHPDAGKARNANYNLKVAKQQHGHIWRFSPNNPEKKSFIAPLKPEDHKILSDRVNYHVDQYDRLASQINSPNKTIDKIKEAIQEATYKGKTVPLNKPMKGDVKKSKVYVDPDGDGKAQKVNFGDKNMSIKKDQPGRKRSYCARSSGQGNLNDKTSANYWSRRAWNCEETEVNELSVPQGTTGRRASVSTPMVAVRMASGKIEKHPPGKSGSSGGGGNGAE